MITSISFLSGRGRGLSRGNQGYIPRGGSHPYGSASYTAREPLGSYQPSINRGRPFDPCNFVGDYDFEEANSKLVIAIGTFANTTARQQPELIRVVILFVATMGRYSLGLFNFH